MTPAIEAPSAIEKKQSLLDQIAEQQAVSATRYMPTLTVKQFTEREEMLKQLRSMLVEGVDYGTIPGTEKPTLYKPGAEKICAFFGYAPHYDAVGEIEDWKGERFGEPLFYYKYACVLSKEGQPVGEGIGSCNSWESKYRYRWVKKDAAMRMMPGDSWADLPQRAGAITEFTFAVDKAETAGKYGKPAAYWEKWKMAIANGEATKIKKTDSKDIERDAWQMGDTLYRVPNDAFPDTINTIQKMGQKRGYIAATLSATGASQYFSQDLEDIGDAIQIGGHAMGTKAAQEYVRDAKMAPRPERTAQIIDEEQAKPAQPATIDGKPAVKRPPKDWELLKEFQGIRADLKKATGFDDHYYTILGAHGYEHSDQIPSREVGREVYKELRQAFKDVMAAIEAGK